MFMDDVKPGVRVRVKIKAADAGETTTGELVGTVEQVDDTSVPLKLRGYGWVASDVIESVEVLARPRMAEPPVKTAVRHAGSIFVQPVGQVQPERTPWLRIDRRSSLGGCTWLTWAEVLELDTTNEPEVIDPRPTAPEAADTAPPAVQHSGLGVRAAEAAHRAKVAYRTGPISGTPDTIRELTDAVTLLTRDLAQVEGELAAAKQRDKDAADVMRRVTITVVDALAEIEHRYASAGSGGRNSETAQTLGRHRAALIEQAARL